ncbi:hypothetical protein K466DRAFT_607169 [Polyporus arcularius HHB13444]|uniref:Uncharacterized protein n=1 Tax=Polyporus arcularius HHB13444 TaxID=1314778 RepID=A0A5C3NLZ2_9APHY|nr:hypothetical protein K466DRAFT_607169 [Polyporus arcularius HHB13444]
MLSKTAGLDIDRVLATNRFTQGHTEDVSHAAAAPMIGGHLGAQQSPMATYARSSVPPTSPPPMSFYAHPQDEPIDAQTPRSAPVTSNRMIPEAHIVPTAEADAVAGANTSIDSQVNPPPGCAGERSISAAITWGSARRAVRSSFVPAPLFVGGGPTLQNLQGLSASAHSGTAGESAAGNGTQPVIEGSVPATTATPPEAPQENP